MSAGSSASAGPRALVSPFVNTASQSYPAHQPFLSEAELDATEWEDFNEVEVEDRFTAEQAGICPESGAARGAETYFEGDPEAGEAESQDRFEGYDFGMEFEDGGQFETDYDSTELEAEAYFRDVAGDLETMIRGRRGGGVAQAGRARYGGGARHR